MDNPRQQVIERLKQASNVLVTVSNNPSVDQLAACIGLALMLNKMGKHGTAVFSGEVPSTIEFLQPEKTIEKNTDSLRDFIIALDKSKADKLRYKVEDRVVKIFITPYRTTLSEKDLEFSQGDFNVDLVVGLGVHQQSELDQAITSHGRILHDATVICINNTPNGDLGNINWMDSTVGSLCELVVQLGQELSQNIFDKQIATALLTGIVAATDRFSNDKTTPQTMSASAKLMEAGANQQLVSTQLEIQPVIPPAPPVEQASPTPIPPVTSTQPPVNDGTLSVDHNQPTDVPQPPATQPSAGQIHIDNEGLIHDIDAKPELPETEVSTADTAVENIESTLPSDDNQNMSASGVPAYTSNTPAMNNLFAASTFDNLSTPTANPAPAEPMPQLNLPPVDTNPVPQSTLPENDATSKPPVATIPDETLEQLEEDVQSPHLRQAPINLTTPSTTPVATPTAQISSLPDIEAARSAVKEAVNSQPSPQLEPIAALNAQTAFDNIQGTQTVTPTMPANENPSPGQNPPLAPLDFPLPTQPVMPTAISNYIEAPSAPAAPPVPPPMTYLPPAMAPPTEGPNSIPDIPL
ncbi:MAG: hypothetical protein ABSD13_20540 [Candidatus Korobacteraceae bacterium]|jgi:nanoRNase/pAp phosphatase (c-di-AMP/oligoRNAs hydrolase)